MITNGKVLVIQRSDLFPFGNKSLAEITIDDYPDNEVPSKSMKSDMVIFVDKGGQTKVLKNRWGFDGIVQPEGLTQKPTNNKWTTSIPKKDGHYWVKARGELSGKIYECIVKVYETQSGRASVFYDGENFNLDDDRFVQWSTYPIDPI